MAQYSFFCAVKHQPTNIW